MLVNKNMDKKAKIGVILFLYILAVGLQLAATELQLTSYAVCNILLASLATIGLIYKIWKDKKFY